MYCKFPLRLEFRLQSKIIIKYSNTIKKTKIIIFDYNEPNLTVTFCKLSVF